MLQPRLNNAAYHSKKPGFEFEAAQHFLFLGYSLHAWLAKDISGMFEEGLIRYWDDVYQVLKIFIRSEGGEVYSNGTFYFPDGVFTDAEKAWARFVRDYNQTSIEANLLKASEIFGQDRELSQAIFQQEYVNRLQGLINAILPMAKDDNAAWTEQQALDWIGT